MSKWTGLVVAALCAIAFGLGQISASPNAALAAEETEAPKPEKGVLVGEVVDIANYAMKGWLGPEHAEASAYHVERGMPVGILDEESGDLFVAVYRDNAPASHLEAANEVLKPLVGKKVAVQGLIYRAEKINLVRIAVVSEY